MDHIQSPTPPIVLVLVGLIASGKSTFAQALEHHFPKYRRCNQDDLGNRRLVENLVRKTLSEGLSVCVDRTNFDAQQRSHWINIAREFPGTSVWVIVFDTPYETCATRLRARTCHPTIKSAEDGLSILARFASDLRLPTPDEGYERIIRLTLEDQPLSPEYSHDQVAAILQRLRDSPPVTLGNLPSSRRGSRAGGGRSFPSNRVAVVGNSRGRGHTIRAWPTPRRGIATTPSARGGGGGGGGGRCSGPVNTAAELPFSRVGDTAESVRAAAGNSDGIVFQRVAGESSDAEVSNGQGTASGERS